uniref:DUF4604 domain-containing protein n=1 Tax=Oncorhynchus tshawytscha TaxID=74940 RepID=A0AAZ3RCG0_ONCTS
IIYNSLNYQINLVLVGVCVSLCTVCVSVYCVCLCVLGVCLYCVYRVCTVCLSTEGLLCVYRVCSVCVYFICLFSLLPTEDKPPADGKILFKKPTKRSSDKFQGITASSNNNKKKKSEGGDEEKKEEKSEKKVKNKSLLSFGEDEDED